MKHSVLVLFFCLVFYLLPSIPGKAAEKSSHVDIFTESSATMYANMTILVKNLTTGEVIDSYRPLSIVPPASVMKVLTTTSALELLGPDFRYPTIIETNGSVQAGILKGNLYIHGYGDPSLCSKKIQQRNFLQEVVSALRQQGITRITGSVIADMTYLDGDATNPQWIWEDIGNYYGMGVFGVNYLDNEMVISLRSSAVGSVAEVIATNPRVPGLKFENHIRCTPRTNDGANVHGAAYSSSRYLCGAVPANLGQFTIKGDLPNPGLLLAQHLDKALEDAGISVGSEPSYIAEGLPTTRTTLYTHLSEPLSEIVKETNIHSNNLYAEAIFRTLGAQISQPGTIDHSRQMEHNIWRSRGVDIASSKIEDGCGLAPQDAVSAQTMVNLLQYMQGSSAWTAFYESLPVSGQTGTLRSFGAGTPLEGRVHAKSGTTSQVKAYAGYIEMPCGDRLGFAVIVNNAAIRSRDVARVIERYLQAIYADQVK